MTERAVVPDEFAERGDNLNNFEVNLPDDKEPAIPGEPKIRSGLNRRLAANLGWLDQPPQ